MNMKFKALLVGAAVAIAGFAFWIPAVNAACDEVAIIRCGVSSQQDLVAKYDQNARSTQTVFSHFGIQRGDLNGFVEGTVRKDGTVLVGDRVVATEAYTAGYNWGQGDPGRRNIPGTEAYTYSLNQLVSDNRRAMVKMVNDTFQFAVIYDCGNPVKGKPVPPKPAPQPVYTCDRLTANKITRTKYSFKTDATAKDGAVITGYEYEFGDGTKQHFVAPQGVTVEHEYAKPGSYTATVMVEFRVGDKFYGARSEACKVQVEVAPENCPIPGKENLPKDSPECKETPKPPVPEKMIEVCDTTTNKIVTIKENEYDGKRYTKDLSQCQPIKVCRISDKAIVTIDRKDMNDNYTTDFSKCTTPVTPTVTTPPPAQPQQPAPAELPKTGIEDVFGGSLGLGSIAGAGYYYVASRRAIGKGF